VLPGERQGVIVWKSNAHGGRPLVQLIEGALHLFLHPGMQHRIGSGKHAFGSHQARGRVQERQQLGRAPAHPEDRASVPAWFAEVVMSVQHFATQGLLAIVEKHCKDPLFSVHAALAAS
jgi:hypothetical protein